MTLHSRLLKIDAGVDWYYYFLHSAKIYGVLQTFFFICGTIAVLMKREFKDLYILVVIVLAGITVQTLLALKGLNLTCSIGQLRYVAVVGPALGIVSVIGISLLWKILRNNIVRSSIMLIFVFIMFILGPYSTPYHNKFEIEKVSEDIVSYTDKNYPGYKLISNMHQLANALDESQTGGKRFTLLSQSNVNNNNKVLIVWCSYLEGSPFVDDDVTLKEIESIPGIKQVKDYKDTVNNCTSIPIYSKYRKEGDEFKRSRDFIDYIIGDQTTWETIDIRVFLKE
ncbi:MAG: hypothetical protein IT281_03705 [Ignavibacteria bacterium]|nr:hypothetical protein [Ignavibacteria bacterium]